MNIATVADIAPGEMHRLDEPHPLTEAQAGLWYMQQLDRSNPILNTGQYIELRGPLDPDLFLSAVETMISETQSLSLVFFETPDGPRQRIEPQARPLCDYRDLAGHQDATQLALADMRADTMTPVDLAAGPLAMFRLYRIGPEHFFWYERIHHLAIDGYGMVLITNRVGEIYSAFAAGEAAKPPLAPLSRAFDENAAYLTAERRETDRAYWRQTLAGMAEPVSLRPERSTSAHWFRRETRLVTAELSQRLMALSQSMQLTWPDVLTAIASLYCLRFSGAQEITAGIPFMARLGNAAARTPCTLMNVLPLRVSAESDTILADIFQTMSRDMIRARRHGRYRSEQMRRDLGLIGAQRRLFGPMINVQPFDLPPRFAGLPSKLHILGAGAVDDITFTFRGDGKDGLTFEVDSNPDIYSDEDTAGHSTRFIAFLEAALTCETFGDIPLATPEEERRFTAEVNATDHPVADTTLTEMLETALRQYAASPALRFACKTMTYRQLDEQSAALAARLAEKGAGPEKIVAVALPRSFELVVGLVAILRAGAAYLPLDPDHPRERLARILGSAQPVAVLVDAETETLFDAASQCILPISPLDEEMPGRAEMSNTLRASDNLAPVNLAPDNLAYVIYTSGSTGEPKGVMIEHRAIVNRLQWMKTHYGIGSHDRILQKTPATFDVSVWEFFLALISGGVLVVAPPGAHRDPEAIAGLIRDEGISTLHFVPSMLSAFLASPVSSQLAVKRVFCSGEELAAELRDRFHARIDGELHNLYGPTETAVDVSYWPASADDDSMPVPIGFPVWNTQLYILDANMRPLPASVVGDLYIGGIQVARGYLGRADLTRERFIADPFRPASAPYRRLYRTGDVARWRADGAVEFLGRSDHQVKIRGLRIELGEIEAVLLASGLAREAAVIAREDNRGDRRIVAYLVPKDGYDEDALRRATARALPDYMVPSSFVTLDRLPVTANGKLDRAALPTPQKPTASLLPLSTATEKRLAGLFAEILSLDTILGADTDFFLAGGDSLLAVHLTIRMREVFGFDPGLGALFENPRIDQLATILDRAGSEDAGQEFGHDSGLGPIIRLATGNDERPPLFLIHPAGGIAWGYRALANGLSPARTVYGLQSPAVELDQPLPESLAALAELYAERITAIREQGIIHLGGWSVGGILAQAIAVVLQAKGRQVGMVALLDAYPCDCWRAEPEPDETTALRALLTIGGHDPDQHADLVSREAIVSFLKRSKGPLGRLPERAVDGVIRAVLDTNRLVRQHYHRHYAGTLTHLRAALDHKDRDLRADMWRNYSGAVDAQDIPFLHAHIASRPAVPTVAPILAAAMALHEG